MRILTLAPFLAVLLAAPAYPGDLDVSNAWIRGTVPGQKATGAFMTLTSTRGATLLGASTPVAGVTEVHEMKMDGNVMRMQAVARLEVPAGRPLSLAPGGYHVMLMDLKKPLSRGETVPLSLKFQGKDGKAETLELKVEVRDLTAPGAMSHDHH